MVTNPTGLNRRAISSTTRIPAASSRAMAAYRIPGPGVSATETIPSTALNAMWLLVGLATLWALRAKREA